MARGIYCALGELAIHSPSPVYARRGLLDALREKCTETVPTPFTAQEIHAFSTAVFEPVPLSCISTVQKVLTEANPDFVDYIRFKVAAHKEILHAFNRNKRLPAKTAENCVMKRALAFRTWSTKNVSQYTQWKGLARQFRFPKRAFTHQAKLLAREYARQAQHAAMSQQL